MTLHRERNPVFTRFYLFVIINQISDLLPLKYTTYLSFDMPIDYEILKSMLGFIKRISYNFKNLNCSKALYIAHVLSYLECYCMVWSPDNDEHFS